MKFRFVKLLILGYAAIFTAYSCNKDLQIGDYISSVEIVEEHDNPLRVPVEIVFTKSCYYKLEYWQKGNPSVSGSTSVYKTAGGKETATVMFLYPDTEYEFRVVVNSGSTSCNSDIYGFTTGSLPIGIPEYTVSGAYPQTEIPGYIFQWQATAPGWVSFCDTDGNIVWYEQLEMAARQVTFDQDTRTIVMLLGFKTGQNDPKFQRWCKKIVVMDLEGNRSVDIDTDEAIIATPHHEIKRMPDGNIAILHSVVKKFDLTPVGGKPDTEVYGDGITIVTPDLQTKVWEWDVFGELDPVRDEYLEIMTYNERSGLYPRQIDLVHANSIGWDGNGNIYFTLNHLNELWKIDRTTGKVIYRVGDYGNIYLAEEDHASGLHAAEPLAENKVLCLNNGKSGEQSRAMIYEVNPLAKVATVTLSVSIPAELSSYDRSNAMLSRDGSMMFFGSTMGRCNVFTDLEGNVLKVIKRTGISYRSYYYETVEY